MCVILSRTVPSAQRPTAPCPEMPAKPAPSHSRPRAQLLCGCQKAHSCWLCFSLSCWGLPWSYTQHQESHSSKIVGPGPCCHKGPKGTHLPTVFPHGQSAMLLSTGKPAANRQWTPWFRLLHCAQRVSTSLTPLKGPCSLFTEQQHQLLHWGKERTNLHHKKPGTLCDKRFPVCFSLRKVALTPGEMADMLHVTAFEPGPSLGWENTEPLAVKASKELLAPESSVSENIWQKPASQHSYIL
jgi:hypothetical protein